MNIEDNLKQWVNLDNEYTNISNKLKEIRIKKNDLTNTIISQFHEKNIKNPTINISDGKLNLIDTKQANTLTFKFLETCLDEYFNNNNDKTKEVIDFIKSKRNFTLVTSIKRTSNSDL
tara:strand:- start:308 stop:661 length:354 start_codon:yes stop_codon:yes gene_type:complete